MAKKRTLEDAVERELQSLRKQQAEAVMPLIGPLLDAWDGVPNDMRGEDELAEFPEHMDALNRAIEV